MYYNVLCTVYYKVLSTVYYKVHTMYCVLQSNIYCVLQSTMYSEITSCKIHIVTSIFLSNSSIHCWRLDKKSSTSSVRLSFRSILPIFLLMSSIEGRFSGSSCQHFLKIDKNRNKFRENRTEENKC